MNSVWIEVGDNPSVAFYLGRRPPANDLPPIAYPTLAELGKLRRPLGIGVEAANVSIAWDNATGETSALLRRLSNSVRVRRIDDTGQTMTLFEGVFRSAPGGDQRLSATAVGDALLEPLALRKTSVLPNYSSLETIPQVFGESVAIRPLPYDPSGTEWLASDRLISRVRAIFDGDDPLGPDQYLVANQVDALGRPVGVVALSDGPKSPERLTFVVDGAPDPEIDVPEGSIPLAISNPAELVRFILRELAGVTISRGRLDRFRRDTIEIKLRGVVDQSYTTPQALIDDIARSSGARWSPQAPGLMVRWPPERGDNDPLYFSLKKLNGWDVVSEKINQISQLVVNYDYDWSAGDFAKTLILRAPDRYREIGEIEDELNLRWVGDDKTAELIGSGELSYRAANAYRVTFTTLDRQAARAAPGQYVFLDHPHSDIEGAWPLVEASIDPLTNEIDMTAEGYIGSLANVVVVQRAQRQSLSTRGIQIKATAGSASIAIADPDTGRPLAGAQVVVDNRVFITDATGEIIVPGVVSGQTLKITVTPAGGSPFIVTQTVA